MHKRVLSTGAAVMLAAAVLVVPARADFIPIRDSTPPVTAPGTFYYNLQFNNSVDLSNPGNPPSEELVSGNYIAITGAGG